ncbi:MAG: Golgi apyrase [Piccolia ochrophora]|nr:MAG: Golgi apyrase [Piccolia ochrophora]
MRGIGRYGVILDAGSSGTRIHVYKWLDSAAARKHADVAELKNLPVLRTEKKWTHKAHPGISTFGEDPGLVGPYLTPLFEHAYKHIPKDAVADTPIFLLATAGMRLLPNLQRKRLLQEICTYTQAHTDFHLSDCDLQIQVIPGETEGLYGWIATNYLLGGFDAPADHAHGKGHHTYGFLDMGGASAQIAFAPNATEAHKHANDLKLVRMRRLDGRPSEYRVFVTTWLGFGVHEARRKFVDRLYDASAAPGVKELPDPCLPAGLKQDKSGAIISTESTPVPDGPYLIGKGDFQGCLKATYPILDKDAPCEDEPCLFHGVHAPAIDFDVNHFVGISEYWHTTHEIFEMGHKEKSYDLKTYQERVEQFCSKSWKTIVSEVEGKKLGKKVTTDSAMEVCFKASWLINMLHQGIGIPRVGIEDTQTDGHNGTKEVMEHAAKAGFLDPFQAVNKIHDTEVSWTLGKMVLYAASQVPPNEDSLDVGFGSNVNGTPPDFQFAGGKLAPLPDAHHHPFQEEEATVEIYGLGLGSNSSRRIPGFALFLLIICIAAYLWCGRDRRSRLFRRLGRPLGWPRGSRKRKFFGAKLFGSHGSGHYERVLEDGDAPADFELGEVDSENDHSDSSEGSLAARSSGWATPRLKVGFEPTSGPYSDNIVSQGVGLGLTPSNLVGNAMERSGLVGRTDSRERLGPTPTGLGSGWSRPASPTRHKSPLMRSREKV